MIIRHAEFLVGKITEDFRFETAPDTEALLTVEKICRDPDTDIGFADIELPGDLLRGTFAEDDLLCQIHGEEPFRSRIVSFVRRVVHTFERDKIAETEFRGTGCADILEELQETGFVILGISDSAVEVTELVGVADITASSGWYLDAYIRRTWGPVEREWIGFGIFDIEGDQRYRMSFGVGEPASDEGDGVWVGIHDEMGLKFGAKLGREEEGLWISVNY